MSLLYIAAPLGASTAAHRRWHRERAELLAALAFAAGYTPVCVHTYAETAMGPDTDPDARERGLARSLAAVRAVAVAWGGLWVLLRDDGTPGAGCAREIAEYNKHLDPIAPASNVWAVWRTFASNMAPHLLPEFDRLTEPPPGPELTGVWKDTPGDSVMHCARTGAVVAALGAIHLRFDGKRRKIPEGTPPGKGYTWASSVLRDAGYVVPGAVEPPDLLSLLASATPPFLLPWSPILNSDGQVIGAELPHRGVEVMLQPDPETGWRLEVTCGAQTRTLRPEQLHRLPAVLAELTCP